MFQFHILIVAAIMGMALIGPAAEWIGVSRKNALFERLARDLSHIIVLFFAFGATFAVFALAVLYAVYPRVWGVLTTFFFGQMVAVLGIWFVMTISAYLYYYTWKPLENRRGWHIAIGWLFAASAFVFISLIIELSSFQLTPVVSGPPLAAAVNPSWPGELIHRHIGNLSYAGFVLAGYSSFRLLWPKRKPEDAPYYDWLGHAGLMVGIGFALVQPFAGWFYARQVQYASPGAFIHMMIATNSWMFLVQSFFLGAVIFLGNTYLALAVRRGELQSGPVSWMRYSLWAIAILVLLLILPQQIPLGLMTPWKYIALGGLIVLSVTNLVLYLRARRTFVWGRAGRAPHLALVLAGIAIMALMITMGTIREGARGSDLIYEHLFPSQGQQISP